MMEANRPIARIARRLRFAAKRVRAVLRHTPDSFLGSVRGVVHVGANQGQERDLYETYGLKVVWIEPNPAAFDRLVDAIRDYPRQRAFKYLVTEADDREYAFHLSNNEGQSSSILELAGHKGLWPEVTYTETITIPGIKLPTLFSRERIDPRDFDVLVVDTQGSELHVLRGAESLLSGFKFIKAEVADFESYQGCCRMPDLDAFLAGHGFRRQETVPFFEKNGVGAYFEVIYASSRV